MLIASVAIIAGFICLIWSADQFVTGAASIAENLGMSPVMIGLTIVSIGTSAPEILVSLIAAINGAGQLAIGNAIGSNLANIGLVLSITLLISPMVSNDHYIKHEIPLLIVVMVGVSALIVDGNVSQIDGAIMVVVLVLILIGMIWQQSHDVNAELSEQSLAHMKPLRAWLTFFVGLALLIASSRLLVWGATEIAQALGVSELIIGLTIVAIGTSLPELAASVAGALRGHTDIALGNIVGSNLFNILGVMAIPGLVSSQVVGEATLYRDYLSMVFITVVLAVAMYLGLHAKQSTEGTLYLGRSTGALLLSLYALYYAWLYISSPLASH